jgi:hypothetical protein
MWKLACRSRSGSTCLRRIRNTEHCPFNMPNSNICNHASMRIFPSHEKSRYYASATFSMQLHTGAEHFGNVIKRGIAKCGCS